MEPLTLQKRIRFLIEYIKGYSVYYIKDGDNFAGYCTVSRGGVRYSFAKYDDIVVGPYFVAPEYRGKKLSEIMVGTIINELETEYKYVYEWIRNDNVPSIKCAEKLGLEKIKTVKLTRFLRRIVESETGNYIIYRRKINLRKENATYENLDY